MERDKEYMRNARYNQFRNRLPDIIKLILFLATIALLLRGLHGSGGYEPMD